MRLFSYPNAVKTITAEDISFVSIISHTGRRGRNITSENRLPSIAAIMPREVFMGLWVIVFADCISRKST